MDARGLAAALQQRVGRHARVFAAPGRVNLIGEHTDYNDGFVLPFAIERQTMIAAVPRDDRKVVVRSRSLGVEAEIDLDIATPRKAWTDYIAGVARTLQTRGVATRGAELEIDSDIPAGAGLSSSAALEMAAGLALSALADCVVDRTQLALAGQEAEHTWVGTRCGIMDQLVVARGMRDHALLIDCRSLEARAVPLALGDHVILVCDSGVKHELAASDYNRRRFECETGVSQLRAAGLEIHALRDVSIETLTAHTHVLDSTVRKRCRHVVSENQRTLDAATALAAGDLVKIGTLMNASHASLRDDYEVSCAELDLLVETAQAHAGVLGARMTGGGFGGCTVNLVEQSRVDAVTAALGEAYEARFGRRPSVFVTRAADGVREISAAELRA
jgi:galactokinase